MEIEVYGSRESSLMELGNPHANKWQSEITADLLDHKHRPEIENLFLDNFTVKEIKQKMQERHGINASYAPLQESACHQMLKQTGRRCTRTA